VKTNNPDPFNCEKTRRSGLAEAWRYRQVVVVDVPVGIVVQVTVGCALGFLDSATAFTVLLKLFASSAMPALSATARAPACCAPI